MFGHKIFLGGANLWLGHYFGDVEGEREQARMGMMEAATQLFGSRWGRCYENFLSPIEKAWRENDWTAIRACLGKERFEAAYEESKSMTYE